MAGLMKLMTKAGCICHNEMLLLDQVGYSKFWCMMWNLSCDVVNSKCYRCIANSDVTGGYVLDGMGTWQNGFLAIRSSCQMEAYLCMEAS